MYLPAVQFVKFWKQNNNYLLIKTWIKRHKSRNCWAAKALWLIHSWQSKVSSLYPRSTNKLTAAFKKTQEKKTNFPKRKSPCTDLKVRKIKAESSKGNQIAKLFELVDCCSEHAESGVMSTLKYPFACICLLSIKKKNLAVKNDYL